MTLPTFLAPLSARNLRRASRPTGTIAHCFVEEDAKAIYQRVQTRENS